MTAQAMQNLTSNQMRLRRQIAKAVETARIREGLMQNDLAANAGVDESVIQDIEQPNGPLPDKVKLLNIFNLAGVQLDRAFPDIRIDDLMTRLDELCPPAEENPDHDAAMKTLRGKYAADIPQPG